MYEKLETQQERPYNASTNLGWRCGTKSKNYIQCYNFREMTWHKRALIDKPMMLHEGQLYYPLVIAAQHTWSKHHMTQYEI